MTHGIEDPTAAEGVARLNRLSLPDAQQALKGCCGAQAWWQAMANARPFHAPAKLHEQADLEFEALSTKDWIEAFTCHPRIGDLNSLKMKFTGNQKWSGSEQSGVSLADDDIIARLAEGNQRYEAQFGYLFIVCATGKSAKEMLTLLDQRLKHSPEA
ncbi:MAG: 2-oxo-4-hydroxy-4-carboxy-5-ureidoimidazoline decarboxylase, partial [Planctomycetota bacterium]